MSFKFSNQIGITRCYEPLKKWIGKEKKHELKMSGCTDRRALKSARTAAQSVFTKNLIEACHSLKKPLNGRLNPIQCSLPIGQFLYYAIKSQVDEYLLENPDDFEFQKEWERFCIDLAVLRTSKSKDQIRNYLQFLEQIKVKMSFLGNEAVRGPTQEIIDVIAENIKDPDLFDINLFFLLNMTRFKDGLILHEKHSIENAQNIYYLHSKSLYDNAIWICRKIDELIEPYKMGLKFENTLSVEKRFNALAAFKEILKTLPVCEDTLQSIIQQHKSKHELFKRLASFSGTKDSSFPYSILVARAPEKLLKRLIKIHGEDYEEPVEMLFQEYGRSEIVAYNLTLNELRQSIAWAETVHKCHALLDTYLVPHIHELRMIGDLLIEWSMLNSDTPQYKGLIAKIPRALDISKLSQCKLPTLPSQTISPSAMLDIEKAVAFCEGGSTRKSGKSKNSGRSFKSTKIKSRKVSASKGASSSSSCSIAPFATRANVNSKKASTVKATLAPSSQTSLPTSTSAASFEVSSAFLHIAQSSCETPSLAVSHVPRETLLIQGIRQRIQDLSLLPQQHHYQKSSLRQVEMALLHLTLAHQNLSDAKLNEYTLYHYLTVISKAYYLIEQALRYKVIVQEIEQTGSTDGDLDHLIKKKLNKLKIQHLPCASIAKELYAANAWLCYTYEQISRRQYNLIYRSDFPVPEQLLTIYQAVENLGTSSEMSDKAERVYQSTLNLIEELFTDSLQLVESEEKVQETMYLSLVPHADLTVLRSLLSMIESEIGKLNSISDNPSLFQSRITLKQLESTLQVINLQAASMTPELFSLHVKEMVNLMNSSFENSVKAAIYSQTGESQYGHSLIEMLIKIGVMGHEDEALRGFAANYFNHLSADSRYAFDHGRIGSILHECILKAEMLRERPELDCSFAIKSKSKGKTLMTDFNFIRLTSQSINAQQIYDTLIDALAMELNILSTYIMPKFIRQEMIPSSSA